MTLKLVRTNFREDGIFSKLLDEAGNVLFYTLEHSYFTPGMYDFKPKLYDGEFKCVRGMHRLEGMAKDFETFEITGVTGHTDILFHKGNWNHDSAGCVLLGLSASFSPQGSMVVNSAEAFAKFLALTAGLSDFQLIVQSPQQS